ncbi:hypothetical protein BDW59DRAFT_150547 [Aspergillus cavernicola]|uniref:Uncharacterized protein n=1 Tax=Aspergillus cavernicola TaxID=176166 RepID=A0ABR4HZ86_9EURO
MQLLFSLHLRIMVFSIKIKMCGGSCLYLVLPSSFYIYYSCCYFSFCISTSRRSKRLSSSKDPT